MPGPGPHLIYALGSGLTLMSLSGARFGPHHCLVYAINAFFGPDVGSFVEWRLISRILRREVDPRSPLLYSAASRLLVSREIIDSFSGVRLRYFRDFVEIWVSFSTPVVGRCPLTKDGASCWSLQAHYPIFSSTICQGEIGKWSFFMYTWILSTGWWETSASIDPDSVIVIGLLCTILLAGFGYIYRFKAAKLPTRKGLHRKSLLLILGVGILYCSWCVTPVYLASPRRPAVGEEADLGVLVFLAVFFFLPNCLCVLSMNMNADSGAQETHSPSRSTDDLLLPTVIESRGPIPYY